MKRSYFIKSHLLWSLILVTGLALIGCKKETPPPEKVSVPTASTPDESVKEKDKEKEFLSDPNVVICELEETTISKIDLPKHHMASFIRRMERDNREYLKESRITLANRPHKIILGEKTEREFYLYDVETGIGPYWCTCWISPIHRSLYSINPGKIRRYSNEARRSSSPLCWSIRNWIS
ncbi:MAG: hypothetical protein JXM79_17575 [Sedimentisphaerales bacterium]|nr:hypothetical protein [Sedimentisphaerales bacterium]